MNSNKRSQDQINKIRDHLKRMISSPLHTNDTKLTNHIPSNNLNIISFPPQVRSKAMPPHVPMDKLTTQNRVSKPLSINPMVKNPDMFNQLKLTTACNKKVVSSNGRLCKVRKYNHTTLLQHLRQRKDTFSHLIKPDLSYGQMICLAILQSPEEKLILSQICEWISTSFPFFQLTDMDWQNCIRHTLSINPSFIKLESIKISKVVDNKTKFVFINKNKPSANTKNTTKNFRKSSRWGVTPTGVLTFFDYEEDGFESFKATVKQINQFLPGMNELTFIPMFPQEQTQQKALVSTQKQQQQQQFQYQFQHESPNNIRDGSNSSSPLSIISNNPTTTSSMSSATDLATMNNKTMDNTSLMAPSIIISNSPPITDPLVKEDSEIIYDIDAKLDLLKTPKFDTSPIRKYFLNNIDTKLEGNINDNFQVNKLNSNILSPDLLNFGSPTHLPIHSILNTFDDRNFVFHL